MKPLIIAAAALLLAAHPFGRTAHAQTISESHEAAAREALAASGASQPFDDILLRLGARVKDQLVNARPELADQIGPMVDEETIKLAPRRGDLEREAAQIYARTFTEEELRADRGILPLLRRQEDPFRRPGGRARADQGLSYLDRGRAARPATRIPGRIEGADRVTRAGWAVA